MKESVAETPPLSFGVPAVWRVGRPWIGRFERRAQMQFKLGSVDMSGRHERGTVLFERGTHLLRRE